MARILTLFTRTPLPLTDGARIRVYNMARILNQNHTVDMLIIHKDGYNFQSQIKPLIKEFNEVNLFSYPLYRFYRNLFPGIISKRPLQVFHYSFRDVRHWIRSHKDRYDLFYCNYSRTAEYVRHLHTPKVVDLVDATAWDYAKAAEGASLKRRLVYPVESYRLLQYERNIIQEFDHSFIATKADKNFLITDAIQSNTLSILPNGVKNHLLTYPKSDRENNWIVFLGRMNYFPNTDAAIYFANTIFPKIRKLHPNMKFLIVGKNPTSPVQKLEQDQGIQVTGFVEEPAEYLAQAKVVVAPMRFGSGIQNKILEAMALGKPVVTTTLGREGISAIDSVHLYISDTPQNFANTVNKLLENQEERQKVGQNARKLIREKYTWNAIASKLLTSIQTLL